MTIHSSSPLSLPAWIRVALDQAQITYSFNQDQLDRLHLFFRLRSEWNQVHNLTGPKASLLKSTDLIDALAVSLCMDYDTPLVDIGTGSGTPGLLVACLHPHHPIFLVEPSSKRCAFLRTALFQLGLKHIQVYRTRWPSDKINHIDQIQPISRAVVSPEDWPHLAIKRPSASTPSPKVSHILQMLALHRPTWPLSTYQCTQEVHYFDPEGGARCVRRWSLHA